MQIGKFTLADFKKLTKELEKSNRAHTILLSTDGPKTNFSYEGQDGKLVTITLFDSDSGIKPIITKTETLL